MKHATSIPIEAPRRGRAPSPGLRRRGGAFTIIELLVVVAIILIAVVAILPAFGRIVESQNYASAINSVTSALGSARARAVTGKRTGVVFLWDMEEEQCSMLLVEESAQGGGSLTNQVTRRPLGPNAEAFWPVSGSAPILLPKGIGIFGLSSLIPVGQAVQNPIARVPVDCWEWYAGDAINVSDGQDNDNTADDIYLWLFPRSDPRLFTDPESPGDTIGEDPWDVIRGELSGNNDLAAALAAVRNATTFFVVFSPDGSISTSRRTGSAEYVDAFLEYPDEPVDVRTPGSMAYDDPARFDPENFGLPPLVEAARSPNREAMLRSADQLAIVDLGRMADGVGVPRPWLVRPTSSRAPQPAYLNAEYFRDDRARAVSRWIDANAEVISFNRYTGNVIRRSAS